MLQLRLQLFRFFNLLVLFLAFCRPAEAEIQTRETHDRHWLGLSAFGIQSRNFQGRLCGSFLKTVFYSPNPSIAILYNTFGTDNRCLVRFWESAKSKGQTFLTQIHFSNEAGRRASNLDDFDFQPDLSVDEYNLQLELMPRWLEKEIRFRVREILALIADYTNDGKFILSTGLEDNYTPLAWENLYNIIKSEWPYAISRNPVQNTVMRKMGWQAPPEIIMEFHGYTKRYKSDNLCITNGDGQDVDFLKDSGLDFRDSKSASYKQVTKWMTKAKERNCITFIWVGKWQGWYNSVKASRPLDRRFKFDKEDMPVLAPLLDHSLEPVDPSARKRKRRKKL